MKAIIDTNVVLDVLLDREPFVKPAVELFCLIEESRIDAFICATTVTTIDYLLVKSLPKSKARNALSRLISLFEIATVNRPVIERAFESKIKDFEDAVLNEAGQMAGVDFVITRNAKDFTGSSLKICDPNEFLASMEAAKNNFRLNK